MDNTFDRIFYDQGKFIGGVDESGVSEIAGPLVAACVIFPKIDEASDLYRVDDSKELSEATRKELVEIIYGKALAIGIAEIQPSQIDYLGPHRAAPIAMERAVMACKAVANQRAMLPDLLLIDGKRSINLNIKQVLIKDGDKKSLSIAAASIVAKVWRDGIMRKLHEQYPYYKWANNKGALNVDHLDGLDKHGVQIGIHRIRQWPFVWKPKNGEKHPQQEWINRTRKWRAITCEKMTKEVAHKLWTSEPPLLGLSQSYRSLCQKTANYEQNTTS